MDTPVYHSINWSEVEDLVLNILEDINARGDVYECIYAIKHGGIIPAALLAYKLKIPMLIIAPNKKAPELSNRVLIVDDVADHGNTLEQIFGEGIDLAARDLRVAVLFYKPWCRVKEIRHIGDVTEKWVIFPWENR